MGSGHKDFRKLALLLVGLLLLLADRGNGHLQPRLLAVGGNATSPNSNRVLSRRRRFVLPTGNGITLKTTFKLTFPLEFFDTSSKLEISLPLTYDFDSGE